MPPLNLLIKPASGSCNMRCRYCFYTDEAACRVEASKGMMSADTMELLVQRALDYADGACTFTFQGGEPTLAGLDFFRALSACVSAHPKAKELRIGYTFQTNGLVIDEAWARWFAENRVLVGVSLDGPKDIHDRNRVDAAGKGTFTRVMRAIDLLDKHGVDYNILTVVSAANARRGRQVYDFFKKQDFRYQQYIECLDPLGEAPGGHEYSLTPEKYEAFLKAMFDAWYQDMKAGRYVNNRYFENLMMIMTGQRPESCAMQGVCSAQWVIEADGSVYPCDFYALDEWYLGNIHTHSFAQLEQQRQKSGFVQQSCAVPDECKACPVWALCRNGCRRNRTGEDGRNYFCAAYRGFLEYAIPRLQETVQLLRAYARTGKFPSGGDKSEML
ncbi:MAG: anaerobic sulfatase maturase [Oscillospiraceae bacterium]|nr:anaerobic sulfatase maturase [Oscillospiraceae bacterium]